MFAQKILANELIDILAAPSYSPEILSYVNKISDAVVLKDFLIKKPKLGVTGTIAKDYVSRETPDAIPYISTKQVSGLYAYIEDAKFISKSADIEWEKCRVYDGNIVINKSGNVGAAAIVKASPYKYVNSVSDIISIEINESLIDKEYLVVYLNSPYGQKQLQRLSGGAIFDHVSLHAIPNIKIFSASILAQKYIADKVRQAERLHGWAKETERKVNIFHLTFIPKQDHLSFDKKFRNVKSFQMTERLDAHFYPSVVEDYIAENIDSFQNMSEITSSVFNGQTQPEDLLGADTIKQITVANLSSNFLMGEPRFVQELTNSSKFIRKYDLLICNAAHNKSYIGKDITYVHSEDKLLPSTEVMVIRVNRDELPASYVRTYLNTKIGYIQIQSTVRGITAHSYPDDVKTLNIYIPKVCGQQREEWFLQDLYLAKAGLANEYSTKLVKVAKYLVEALIEGILTEEELIQAQNTLEQADPSLDRAILNQMTEDGYAVTGSKPLFADLDEFYDLLEQAKALE